LSLFKDGSRLSINKLTLNTNLNADNSQIDFNNISDQRFNDNLIKIDESNDDQNINNNLIIAMSNNDEDDTDNNNIIKNND